MNHYIVDHIKTRDVMFYDKIKRNIVFHAFTYAMNSEIKNGRHCAIVFYKSWDNIIAMSINDDTNHAEINAMEMITDNVDVNKCFILVVRANMLGKMSLSMPCNKCKESMTRRGIRRCIYSIDHFKFKKCIL